jgi:hypothetical protein
VWVLPRVAATAVFAELGNLVTGANFRAGLLRL